MKPVYFRLGKEWRASAEGRAYLRFIRRWEVGPAKFQWKDPKPFRVPDMSAVDAPRTIPKE